MLDSVADISSSVNKARGFEVVVINVEGGEVMMEYTENFFSALFPAQAKLEQKCKYSTSQSN